MFQAKFLSKSLSLAAGLCVAAALLLTQPAGAQVPAGYQQSDFDKAYDNYYEIYNKSDLQTITAFAKAGNHEALSVMGDIYSEGDGVPVDENLAAKYYGQLATLSGDAVDVLVYFSTPVDPALTVSAWDDIVLAPKKPTWIGMGYNTLDAKVMEGKHKALWDQVQAGLEQSPLSAKTSFQLKRLAMWGYPEAMTSYGALRLGGKAIHKIPKKAWPFWKLRRIGVTVKRITRFGMSIRKALEVFSRTSRPRSAI